MLFVTAPREPKMLAASMKNFSSPTMQLRFYNYTESARSVYEIGLELKQTHNISGVFEAWSLLRPWAFKADLWRALVLWKYGGIYLDNELVLTQPLERWASLADNETLSTCFDFADDTFQLPKEDRRDNFTDFRSTWNAVLSAKRGSPVILEIIQAILHNVETRSLGLPTTTQQDLAVTGPVLYGYVIATSSFKNTVRLPCANRAGNGVQSLLVEGNLTTTNATDVIIVADEEEHGLTQTTGINISYGELHKRGQIYCDNVTNWYGPHDRYACAIGNETLEAIRNETADACWWCKFF
ncbi:expressed unknown protein [Seminavis robusta]|uniref:Uncharacterized protein n=1 Tax=Seminavis robusta TaxID=568900 RepID=A0A9N8HQW0_9STRA|nr:expressed unknown protein [Seminavis robusta]|eukprot:Sro1491_g277120.1 n/a (297) ;mRNA; r:14985-15977